MVRDNKPLGASLVKDTLLSPSSRSHNMFMDRMMPSLASSPKSPKVPESPTVGSDGEYEHIIDFDGLSKDSSPNQAAAHTLAPAWEPRSDDNRVTSSHPLSPESPLLITPPMQSDILMRVANEHPSRYKGKGKTPSPPSPTSPSALSSSSKGDRKRRHRVSDHPVYDYEDEIWELEKIEALNMELAIELSLRESPCQTRINDDYVEGESPSGPSHSRSDDQDSLSDGRVMGEGETDDTMMLIQDIVEDEGAETGEELNVCRIWSS